MSANISSDDFPVAHTIKINPNFAEAYNNGVIAPINPSTNPGCFELKNPGTNIIGIVR